MKNYLELRTNDLDLSKVTYILPYYCMSRIYIQCSFVVYVNI